MTDIECQISKLELSEDDVIIIKLNYEPDERTIDLLSKHAREALNHQEIDNKLIVITDGIELYKGREYDNNTNAT